MAKILYAGDSTVKFNKIDSYPQTGMSQALLLYLREGVKMRSFAQNGRSTKSFIAEGRLAAIEKEIERCKEGGSLPLYLPGDGFSGKSSEICGCGPAA